MPFILSIEDERHFFANLPQTHIERAVQSFLRGLGGAFFQKSPPYVLTLLKKVLKKLKKAIDKGRGMWYNVIRRREEMNCRR